MSEILGKKMKKLKLAFVKQDVYQDLYACPPKYEKAYECSLMRSGPMALFEAFDVDCFVIKESSSNQYWRQKVTDCNHKSIEEWYKIKEKKVLFNGQWTEQSEFSIELSSIDFSNYDIVIAIDACVTKDVIEKYRNVFWCYYISEPCMSVAKESEIKVVEGYNLFLNQMFRPSDSPGYLDLKSPNNSHVCEFPYSFQYPGIFHKLLNIKEKNTEDKLRVIIPSYVRKLLSSDQEEILGNVFDIVTPKGTSVDFISTLCSGDVYLRLGSQTKFGNESLEAVSAGCLFVSTKLGMKNRVFDIDGTLVKGTDFDDAQFTDAIEILKALDSNRERLTTLQKRQQEIALELGYKRPLRDLLSAYQTHVGLPVKKNSAKKLRTIHHQAATGGTLISKCIAALSNVCLVSEVTPSARPIFRFAPLAVFEQYSSQYSVNDKKLTNEFFKVQVNMVYEHALLSGKHLVLRDHNHPETMGKVYQEKKSLLNVLDDYHCLSILTIRDPIDSYLSCLKKGWVKQIGESFDEYCLRYLKFIEEYKGIPMFKYEEFCDEPEMVMGEICKALELDYDPDFIKRFYEFRLTGDSGRKSPEINRPKRREISEDFQLEVLNSINYSLFCDKYGYEKPHR